MYRCEGNKTQEPETKKKEKRIKNIVLAVIGLNQEQVFRKDTQPKHLLGKTA
jgi:hypothetical protein